MRGSEVGVWQGRTGVYFALLTIMSALAVAGAVSVFDMLVDGAETVVRQNQDRMATASVRPTSSGQVFLTQDDWAERLKTREFWSGKGGGAGASAPFPTKVIAPTQRVQSSQTGRAAASDYHDGGEETYRTVCVRTCDGYFWPISFSTTEDYFDRDQAQCASSCGSPASFMSTAIPAAILRI